MTDSTACKAETGKRIIWPGLTMVVFQLRAMLSFGTPGVMSGADVLWIFAALFWTGFFIFNWSEWRGRKRSHDFAKKQNTWWPLTALATIPLLIGGALAYQWVDGPSPYATLKESARTGCNVGGDGWRSATGSVALMETPNGEIVYLYNGRDLGDDVIETRSTKDVDYDWYSSMVLDGRSPRAKRVLCFERGSSDRAQVRDIKTGEIAGSPAEAQVLIELATK